MVTVKALRTALALGVVFASGACSGSTGPTPIPRGTQIIDVSGSARDGIATSVCIEAFDKMTAVVAPNMGTITVERISADPLSDGETIADVNYSRSLAPFADNPVYRDPLAARLTAGARTQVEEAIANAGASRGTDILSSFVLADRVLSRPPLGEAPEQRFLVICSDMMSTTPPLTFYRDPPSDAETERLIAQLQDQGSIPDWTGVDIYVVGAGVTTGNGGDSEKALRVQAFFTAFFEATGGNLVSYESTLPDFP